MTEAEALMAEYLAAYLFFGLGVVAHTRPKGEDKRPALMAVAMIFAWPVFLLWGLWLTRKDSKHG